MKRYSLVMTRQTYKERALTPKGRKKLETNLAE